MYRSLGGTVVFMWHYSSQNREEEHGMKPANARYQQGSISKLPRASGGYVWKVRFSEHKQGNRHQKTLIIDSVKCPTERDVRAALEPTVSRVNAGTDRSRVESLVGTIIEIYREEPAEPGTFHQANQRPPPRLLY